MRIKWFSMVRVTGLLLVLLYHFFQKLFPGGFLGVDVFFTFSGFLITALLIDEFSQSKKIELLAFFRRRFYRIVPPVIVMVLVVMPFTFLIRRDFVAGIGTQIAAVMGFVTNFYEMMTGGSYEAQFIPHLFVHNWSLAVEVHYYLLWGLAVWFLAKYCKTAGQLRGSIFLLSSFGLLISFLSMFIGSLLGLSFSGLYFSTWTHIYPFFVGSILATLTGIKQMTGLLKKIIRSWSLREACLVFAAGAGLLGVMMLWIKFDSLFTYLLGFLLASLSAAAMILATRVLHEKTLDLKEPLVLTVIADTSYGVYLFHWPFYTIFSQLMGNLPAVILTSLLSLAFAGLSFYVIEPIIAGKSPAFLGWDLHFTQLKKVLAMSFVGLLLISLLAIGLAPKIGAFETDMLVNGLHQADTKLNRTKNLAEKGEASSYNIADGVTIIGDSVTLRASTPLKEVLPDAQVDAQGSRNTAQAREIMSNNAAAGGLLKTVVVATGVNIVFNYEEELNELVKTLPKGHRLILVTPYDGNSDKYDNPVAEKHAQYARELAKKYAYVTIADWNTTAKQHPEIWVGSDHIHFGEDADTIAAGGRLYAQEIQKAVTKAADGPVKHK
ncbi:MULTISPECIES: acyltransferase family protein [unclassified Streptococcus]|uniref:acyltransferase family protein n=1 Tax=unclassified Streptococcus TaxID=2608887 RepID=UPI00189D6044|nr:MULTISPECIES: acyltransferase family protein [unclassified Streptococcus]MBF7050822.1 acyltransferase [Streptococcus sp. HF-2466]MBF7076184.1 acyltransferase [Streptococcus sp. HF-100]